MGLYRFQAAFFVGDGDVIWFLRRGFAECTIHQAMPFLCGNDGVIFRLKPLQNLQPMERRRLADILANQSCSVCSHLAASRRRSILGFRLPFVFRKGSLKMKQREMIAQWRVETKQACACEQDVGEPPTRHWLRDWQRFQAALCVELRQLGADLRGGIVYIAACDGVGVVVKALDDGQLAQIIVYVLRGEEASVQIPAHV